MNHQRNHRKNQQQVQKKSRHMKHYKSANPQNCQQNRQSQKRTESHFFFPRAFATQPTISRAAGYNNTLKFVANAPAAGLTLRRTRLRQPLNPSIDARPGRPALLLLIRRRLQAAIQLQCLVPLPRRFAQHRKKVRPFPFLVFT
jgi:hypothetical protein